MTDTNDTNETEPVTKTAAEWWSLQAKLKNAGKPNPSIDPVRTQCWSVTISLKEGSGNTLESVQERFSKLTEKDDFSGCFSEEEGSKENEEGEHYRHAQGAVHFKNKITGKKLKKIFADTKAHLEPARNTAALINYVKKKPTHISGPYRFGHWEELEERNKNQGKRSDLQILNDAITKGMTFLELMEDSELCLMLDHHRTWAIDRVNALRCGRYKKENRSIIDPHGMMLVNDYVFGTSGLAKTGVVQEFFGMENVFPVSEYDTAFPLDGYSGEEILLLDEFKGGIPFKKLLKMMQGYPFKVNVKGGHVWAAWKKVIIVSSVSPLKLYRGIDPKDGDLLQFWRRLSEGVVINANEQPFGRFYPYNSPEDALRGVTRMPKGLKGYGPDYWLRHRLELPDEINYEYADITSGMTQRELYELGYNPDDDNDEENEDNWL